MLILMSIKPEKLCIKLAKISKQYISWDLQSMKLHFGHFRPNK